MGVRAPRAASAGAELPGAGMGCPVGAGGQDGRRWSQGGDLCVGTLVLGGSGRLGGGGEGATLFSAADEAEEGVGEEEDEEGEGGPEPPGEGEEHGGVEVHGGFDVVLEGEVPVEGGAVAADGGGVVGRRFGRKVEGVVEGGIAEHGTVFLDGKGKDGGEVDVAVELEAEAGEFEIHLAEK